jgi:tetratricopeptide (TPR) repeat protein
VSKTTKRRLSKKHIFIYIIVFIAAGGLVLTPVLGYIGYRSFASGPRNEDTFSYEQQIADLEYRIGQLEDGLEKNPEEFYYLSQLGNNYYQLGVVYIYSNDEAKAAESFALAIEPYGKALEIKPEDVDVRVDRAVSAFRSGNLELAEEEFEKAIAINPDHAKAYYNFGVFLFYGLNRPAEAIERFEKVLELDSANDPALISATEFMIAQADDQLKNPPVFDTTPRDQ